MKRTTSEEIRHTAKQIKQAIKYSYSYAISAAANGAIATVLAEHSIKALLRADIDHAVSNGILTMLSTTVAAAHTVQVIKNYKFSEVLRTEGLSGLLLRKRLRESSRR